jgi:hypothetical protein
MVTVDDATDDTTKKKKRAPQALTRAATTTRSSSFAQTTPSSFVLLEPKGLFRHVRVFGLIVVSVRAFDDADVTIIVHAHNG